MDKRKVLIAVGLLAAAAAPLLLFTSSTFHLTGHSPASAISSACFYTATFFSVVAFAFLVYESFNVHWIWGLAVFFIPLAFVPFMILHWRRSKTTIQFLAATIIMSAAGWLLAM
jgi:uncharacterized membrane protein